jgi:hypothetical protein
MSHGEQKSAKNVTFYLNDVITYHFARQKVIDKNLLEETTWDRTLDEVVRFPKR